MLCSKKLNSEMIAYIDEKSGREIIKLTQTGMNRHMYFTDNSFTLGKDEIIYMHSPANLSEGIRENVFSMNLKTGERTQLTEFEKRFKTAGWITKSPDSKLLVFIGDGDLYSLNMETGDLNLICRCPVGYTLAGPFISYDKKYAVVIANAVIAESKYSKGENYNGFKDNFYAVKNSKLIVASTDGSGSYVVFEDTHWMGHVQFAPDTNEYIMFCHEGPWNYVQQRIWILNTVTRQVKPCFVQEEDDSIGHEFWTRDGLIFFDNRGKGHDGTITSDKTQAVTIDPEGDDAIPVVGFADKECNILKTIDLPYYCNHYHANTPNTLLVADAVEDIVLIDISKKTPTIETLCTHNTSWRWQHVHCHPCWSWDDKRILFASDRDEEGKAQLYMVNM